MIRKFLDLSTAHISYETAEALREAPSRDDVLACLVVVSHNYGWWIHVPFESEGAAREGFEDVPEELLAILRYAAKHGCDYVMLDSDAEKLDDLPVFDW